MRILAVSNFYPPYHLTGYELGCRDYVEALRARGHEVRVLTSRDCFRKEVVEDGVYRWLKFVFPDRLVWGRAVLKELVNQTGFARACGNFQPGVVFFFNLAHISATLGLLAEDMGLPACYYIANHWSSVWERDHWARAWPKAEKGARILRLLARRYRLRPPFPPLNSGSAAFSNRYLRDIAEELGTPFARSEVVPWGLDTDRFGCKPAPAGKPTRLLCAGQIRPRKSLHVAIQALNVLKQEHGSDDLTLTIAGYDPTDSRTWKSDYLNSLRDLARKFGLLDKVRFAGWTPRENMPAVYRAHDIFLHPSAEEGTTSLALLEAMSCGLGVVSTMTCGHAEVLRDEDNALVFIKESAADLARQVGRLRSDPALYDSLRRRGRATIEEKFRLEKSVDSVEAWLEQAVSSRPDWRSQTAVRPAVSGVDLHPQRPLAETARRAKKWVLLGEAAVSARALTKPEFLIHQGKKIAYRTAALTALVVLPGFYRAFFRLAGRMPKRPPVDIGGLERILVVQLADMGDVVLSVPFLREFRRARPRAWIGLVVQPSMVNLVELCPYINEIIPWRWRSFRNWNNAFYGHVLWWLQATALTFRRLWRHRLDAAISLRWNNDAPQAAALTLMFVSGAAQRVAYVDIPHDRIPFRMVDINRLITRGPVRVYRQHEVKLQMEILSHLGTNPEEARLEFWTSREDENFAAEALRRSGLADTQLLAAFAPGAAWSYRRWPADRFIALGRWLQETYRASVLVFAAKNERELADEVARGLIEGKTFNLAGQTSIRQMAAILKRCRLFVGNDSGPLHVAAASGVPVAGFFGPGEFERFKPWGFEHEPIRLGFPCSPCSQDCVLGDPRCIRGISLEQAKRAVARLLEPCGPK